MKLPLPKVDLYGPVHRGLRWALSSLLVRMGATDMSDPSRLPRMLDDLDGVLYLCESHLDHEERFIHPALERRKAGAREQLDAEHAEHNAAIAELRTLATALVSAAPGSGAAIGRTLYLRFSSFVADNFVHMLEEETVVEPLLEQLYSAEELRALHDELLAAIGPEELLAFVRVMIPANGQPVRIALLAGAKAAMPQEAFAALLSSIRPSLDADEWAELTDRLGVAA
jgi:hypothetical protein